MTQISSDQLDDKLGHSQALLQSNSSMALALAEYCAGAARLVSTTSAFRKAMGLARKTVDGRLLEDVFGGEDASRLQSLIDHCLQRPARGRGSPSGGDLRGRRVTAHPIGGGGAPLQVVLSIEPSLAAETPSQYLSTRNQRLFDRLGPISSGLLYVYDLRRRRAPYLHPDLAKRLGLPAKGIDLEDVKARVHVDDLPVLRAHIQAMESLEDDGVVEARIRVRGAEGDWLLMQSRARVFARAADGSVRRVIGAASDLTMVSAQAQALERAEVALATAEADERRRIGRELHDSTAQHLVAVGLSLAALERRTVFRESDQAILRDIRNSLSAAHREIRTFAFVLHPPQTEHRPFQDRLRMFADGFGRRASLRISVSSRGEPRQLSGSVEVALFRIFQEALMNVHRHASARSVSVLLDYRKDRVALVIEDDGVGIAESLAHDEETGVGIASMRGRLMQLGGQLELANGQGGLRLSAELPIVASRSWVAEAGAGEPVGELPRRASPSVERRISSTLKLHAVPAMLARGH